MSPFTERNLELRSHAVAGEGGSTEFHEIWATHPVSGASDRAAVLDAIDEPGKEFAERVIASWNVCAGVPIAALRDQGFIALLHQLSEDRVELIAELRKEAAQLRHRAVQSLTSGWSTHQVEPMRERANALDELAAKYEAHARAKVQP